MKEPHQGKPRRSAKADVKPKEPLAGTEVDPDVMDVIREEQSRGRRPVDIAERKRQEEQRLMILKIYRRGTEQQLRQLLRTWEYSDSEIEEKAAIFRRLRQE